MRITIAFKEKIDNNTNERIKFNETTLEHNLNYSKIFLILKENITNF